MTSATLPSPPRLQIKKDNSKWTLMGLKVPEVDLTFDMKKLKQALNIFSSNQENSTRSDQVSSQNRVFGRRRKPYPAPYPTSYPKRRVHNRGKWVPYFTLPKYLRRPDRPFRSYPSAAPITLPPSSR